MAAVLVAALCSPTILASVGVSLRQSFTVPGFKEPIRQIKLNDIDLDLQPEILAADGEQVRLYDPDDDQTLFSVPLPEDYIAYDILLSDVTADGVADIAIACYFDLGVYGPDTVASVELYDGASLYTVKNSAFFEMDAGGLEEIHSAFQTVTLQSFDGDNDGFAEMFFSYDRPMVSSMMGLFVSATSGYSSLFGQFPAEPTWQLPQLYGKLHAARLDAGDKIYLTTRYESRFRLPGGKTATGWLEVLNLEGDSIASVGELLPNECTGDSAETFGFFEYACHGDILPDDYIEVLATHRWQETCFENDAIAADLSGRVLRLYRLLADGSLELIWSRIDPAAYSSFFCSDNHPGYAFAINGDVVSQIDGDNGDVYQSSVPMGVDTLFWAKSGGFDDGCLVAIEQQTVSLYELDISTDVDSEPAISQPKSFTLGNAYPNPFNPSCVIEYSLPTRARTSITVYNTLGQMVTTLVNDMKPAGNHSVVWDGTDQYGQPVASGVYFYQLQADGFIDSRKMLLVR